MIIYNIIYVFLQEYHYKIYTHFYKYLNCNNTKNKNLTPLCTLDIDLNL